MFSGQTRVVLGVGGEPKPWALGADVLKGAGVFTDVGRRCRQKDIDIDDPCSWECGSGFQGHALNRCLQHFPPVLLAWGQGRHEETWGAL